MLTTSRGIQDGSTRRALRVLRVAGGTGFRTQNFENLADSILLVMIIFQFAQLIESIFHGIGGMGF